MQTFIVGGYCRDKLLGLKPHDKDLVAVGATEQELFYLGYKKINASNFPVFIDKDGNQLAMARRDKKVGKGHKGFKVDFLPDVTLEEDLMRRDFTINTITMNPYSEEIVETVYTKQALEDLNNRIIRMVDKNHFADDPLRALRAIRFAAVYDMKIEQETETVCRKMFTTKEYKQMPIERVIGEIERCFNANCGEKCIDLMYRLGALKVFDCNLDKMFTTYELPENHVEETTGGHVLSCLRFLDMLFKELPIKNQTAVYWATLYHDIGKVLVDENTGHFYIHDVAGADYVRDNQKICKNASIRNLMRIVAEHHMRFSHWNEMKPGKRVDMVTKELGGNILGFVIPCVADWYGHKDKLDKLEETSTFGLVWKEIHYLCYQMMFIRDIVKNTKFKSKDECNRIKPEKRGAILRDKAIAYYIRLMSENSSLEGLTNELLDAKLAFLKRVGSLGFDAMTGNHNYGYWVRRIHVQMKDEINYWDNLVEGKPE